MFCDLVESTELAERVDAEDLREVIRAYQTVCDEVIARFGGHVAQYLGDGLLVYFGYPRAHEDAAGHAVRAALEILGRIPALNERLTARVPALRERPIAVRLGIHTGTVVIGEMGAGERRERLASGEAVNLAARLQAEAVPNSAVVSGATARLVRARFVLQELGLRHLKGFAEKVPLFRLMRARTAEHDLELGAAPRLTGMVGREQEEALLADRWQHACEGAGQVVLITGEAGIGKSRLVQSFRERTRASALTWLSCRCSSYTATSSLYPVIQMLEGALRIDPRDPAAERRQKLETTLGVLGVAPAQVMPFLAPLLSMPVHEDEATRTMSPEAVRKKTLHALLTVLFAMASSEPVVLAAEDMQWADPSSRELLDLLADQVPTTRIFAILTCRPEYRPQWSYHSHVTLITLSRLTRDQVAAMIAAVAADRQLPKQVLRRIVQRTDGVPLFVEELTKMVLESDLLRKADGGYDLTQELPVLAIPATLQDSLMARLDRLAPAKEVAQFGAIIGREFTFRLLQEVAGRETATLEEALGELVGAELLYQRGVPPDATYVFKHALIRDTAYQSLLRNRRRQIHEQVARAMETSSAEIAGQHPEWIAHHFTEAGLDETAVAYWYRAGRRALKRCETGEALGHLREGLESLGRLPETAERAQHELPFQSTIGFVLMHTRGYAAAEVGAAYSRARQLSRGGGALEPLGWATVGFGIHSLARADFNVTRDLGNDLAVLADRGELPTFALWSQLMLAHTAWWTGAVREARSRYESVLDAYARQPDKALISAQAGQDLKENALTFLALTNWTLGYADSALVQGAEALRFAEQLANPLDIAWGLCMVSFLHWMRRDKPNVAACAQRLESFSAEHGFQWFSCQARTLFGWALAHDGRMGEGLEKVESGIQIYEELGARLARSAQLCVLAEVLATLGRTDDGLASLDEARAFQKETGEGVFEPEVHRLRGELLLQKSPDGVDEAERCFHRAIDAARSRNAKSFELRAALSLARLWNRQGREDEARRLLQPVHDWFTEGLDSAEMVEARRLLSADGAPHARTAIARANTS